MGYIKYWKKPNIKKIKTINIPHFSIEKNLYFNLSGKKFKIILEPSKGGIGIKLKIANNKFKKQKIIDIKKITTKIFPDIKERIEVVSFDK